MTRPCIVIPSTAISTKICRTDPLFEQTTTDIGQPGILTVLRSEANEGARRHCSASDRQMNGGRGHSSARADLIAVNDMATFCDGKQGNRVMLAIELPYGRISWRGC